MKSLLIFLFVFIEVSEVVIFRKIIMDMAKMIEYIVKLEKKIREVEIKLYKE